MLDFYIASVAFERYSAFSCKGFSLVYIHASFLNIELMYDYIGVWR